MAQAGPPRFFVCAAAALADGQYRKLKLLFEGREDECLILRFEGRRYLVTRGSLDFTNPDRIQPFFDVEADTRVRVPGQTYRVTLRIAGTTERLQPEFTSDPPLPSADVLSLLLSDRTPTGDVEVTSINAPNQREVDRAAAAADRAGIEFRVHRDR